MLPAAADSPVIASDAGCMESSLVMDDSGWSIIDSEGSPIAVGESRTDVMAASAEEVTAEALVVCAAGRCGPLPQAASGTAISASSTK